MNRLALARQVAAHYQRRRQLALLVERIEAIERTPARDPEPVSYTHLTLPTSDLV